MNPPRLTVDNLRLPWRDGLIRAIGVELDTITTREVATPPLQVDGHLAAHRELRDGLAGLGIRQREGADVSAGAVCSRYADDRVDFLLGALVALRASAALATAMDADGKGGGAAPEATP